MKYCFIIYFHTYDSELSTKERIETIKTILRYTLKINRPISIIASRSSVAPFLFFLIRFYYGTLRLFFSGRYFYTVRGSSYIDSIIETWNDLYGSRVQRKSLRVRLINMNKVHGGVKQIVARFKGDV